MNCEPITNKFQLSPMPSLYQSRLWQLTEHLLVDVSAFVFSLNGRGQVASMEHCYYKFLLF